MDGAHRAELLETTARLVQPGKGLLAADESVGTMGKRLEKIGMENTESNRQAARAMLFGSEGIEDAISGVILFEETLFQASPDGTPLCKNLTDRGVVLGIKVDKGVQAMYSPTSLPGETTTAGLDGLGERCKRYYAAGARFAKWRAVYRIGAGCPSAINVAENARELARYAATCQHHGLVPVVEPEILAEGDHGAERCAAVTEAVLTAVYAALRDHGVLLEATLLKPNMVTPGGGAKEESPPERVAAMTLRVLQRTVPPAVPGIMFLSGGQSEQVATANLDALNKAVSVKPWYLSFSFGRALQTSALATWRGEPMQVAGAQAAFMTRAVANSQAALGQFAR
mmetsp:Transcript_5504/g.19140  ORF Transcript_5504/g.19140 Transcript_5504/m.19140 type:complete len:341 (-) Transcript_5504:429-1451(-)